MSLPGPTGRLADLLADAAAGARSGVLTARRGKLKRLICLIEGRLAFAVSNLVEEQFAELLVERKLLSPGDRAGAAADARRAGRPLPAVLVERKLVSREALARAMQGHVRHLLDSCLEWPDGEFRFERGTPSLEGEVTVRLPVAGTLLEHAARHPASLDAVRPRVGNPDLRLRPVEARRALLDGEGVDPDIVRVAEACDGERTLAELLADGPLDEERMLRALFGLRLLGVLAPVEQAARGREAADRPVTRAEAEARLSKSEDVDHYMLLGLERGASRDHVRHAYYELARRMHPDRFRTGELADLLPRVEEFFTKVTEAYNTLFDPDRRSEYDAQLDGERTPAEQEAAAQSDTSFLARQNFLRGRELVERRRLSEALKFLRNAVALDGTKAEYALELGVLLARNPRYRDEAERALRKVIELEPTSVKAYLTLGDLFRRGERFEDAVRMYHEAQRWEPANEEARRQLEALGAGPGKGGSLKGLFRS